VAAGNRQLALLRQDVRAPVLDEMEPFVLEIPAVLDPARAREPVDARAQR